ncbi:hypothetical protein [Frankia sp. Cas3]|uniref:hypothetical protein n=1 Tax=Frankia sp. Cas3 TaxID=3073926 RepID=UPI002AD230C6|nr:hypothetical protein [Frankia sp. Cas3]
MSLTCIAVTAAPILVSAATPAGTAHVLEAESAPPERAALPPSEVVEIKLRIGGAAG